MKHFQIFLVAVLLIFPLSAEAGFSTEPIPFILEKVKENDVVLFGTTHRKDKILDFLAELLPRVAENGITHIGLEIERDQQGRIDNFIKTGEGLDEIEIYSVIDYPKYRHLLQVIRKNSLKPIAIDKRKSKWDTVFIRDEWMARSIAEILKSNTMTKVFVIVGNTHTLKDVEYVWNEEDKVIRIYLERIKPEVKVYSVYSCYDCSLDEPDFRKVSGVDTKGFILETKGLDLPFQKLNNLLNAEPFTLEGAVDAVLVYE